eukprot:TRINITY_DN21117_c0_g1_i1.p2 TRINITY_DN21117_c0_g1~~TRINITY_DN21117_c0_g1_i1.p2  ORF type:complete len:127 (-),score=36.19 TRINITY_DN21117_c0_g1_i1:10-390(-)
MCIRDRLERIHETTKIMTKELQRDIEYQKRQNEHLRRALAKQKHNFDKKDHNTTNSEEKRRIYADLTWKLREVERELQNLRANHKQDINRLKALEEEITMLRRLSLIHICRCRRYAVCRSRWSPYH